MKRQSALLNSEVIIYQIYWPTIYHILVIHGYQYVQWWTHKIRGLHKKDFIMAAKTDELSRH
jgi:hypothetical protein